MDEVRLNNEVKKINTKHIILLLSAEKYSSGTCKVDSEATLNGYLLNMDQQSQEGEWEFSKPSPRPQHGIYLDRHAGE